VRYELEPNQYVLRVYEEHAENYIASALIRVYGDRAWVSSISSPRLFEALPQFFDELLDRLQVTCLEGPMSRAMARAVRMASRSWAHFEVARISKCAGRNMEWVVISKRETNGV
jgi:hypothetical protein